MADSSVGSTSPITYVTNGSNKKIDNSSIDTEVFLNLLVAQLKYQDPLAPQDNTSFVTQLAQMSSLNEMQDMNSSLKNSQAYDMIGMDVYAEVLNKTTGVKTAYGGLVDSVVIKEGIPYVVVGNTAIAVADVLQVYYPLPADDTPTDDDTPPTK